MANPTPASVFHIIPGQFLRKAERVLANSAFMTQMGNLEAGRKGEAELAAKMISEKERSAEELQNTFAAQLEKYSSQAPPMLEKPQASPEDALAVLIGGVVGGDFAQLSNVAMDRAKSESARRFENAKTTFELSRESAKLGMGMTQDRLTQKLADIRDARARKDGLDRDVQDIQMKTLAAQDSFNQNEQKIADDYAMLDYKANLDRLVNSDNKEAALNAARVSDLTESLNKLSDPASVDTIFDQIESIMPGFYKPEMREVFRRRATVSAAQLAIATDKAKAEVETERAQAKKLLMPPAPRASSSSDGPGYNPMNPMEGSFGPPGEGVLPPVPGQVGPPIPPGIAPAANNQDAVANAIHQVSKSSSPLSDVASGRAVFPLFREKDGSVKPEFTKILGTASQRAQIKATKGDSIARKVKLLEGYIGDGAQTASAYAAISSILKGGFATKAHAAALKIDTATLDRLNKALNEDDDAEKARTGKLAELDTQFRANSKALMGQPGYKEFALALHERALVEIKRASDSQSLTPEQKKSAQEKLRDKFEEASGIPWDLADSERARLLKKQSPAPAKK